MMGCVPYQLVSRILSINSINAVHDSLPYKVTPFCPATWSLLVPVPVPASTFRWYRWCRHPAEEAWKTNCQDQKRQNFIQFGRVLLSASIFVSIFGMWMNTINSPIVEVFSTFWYDFVSKLWHTITPFGTLVFCFGLSSRSRNSIWGHFEGSLWKTSRELQWNLYGCFRK